MIYAKWAGLIVCSFAVDLLGLFIVPFAIALSDGERLPVWAWIWDNDSEPLGDVDRKVDIDAATGVWRGFLRWRWLCLRNPGNNFGYLIGFVQAPTVSYVWSGDPETSDQGHAGELSVEAQLAGKTVAFCYYDVWRWSRGRCLRIFIGWKIHDNIDEAQRALNAWKFAQIVCVVNPFMTFTERGA